MTEKRKNTDGGFTLMETIVTIGLAAMLLAVYFTVLNSVFFLRRIQYQVQAANFVQEEIEALRSLEFSELLDRSDGDFLGIPFNRGPWKVKDASPDAQGNVLTMLTAQEDKLGETGLIVVPGNYRDNFLFSAKVYVPDAAPSGWRVGLAFRYRDSENHYRFWFSNGGLAFDKVEHGSVTTTQLDSPTLLKDTWYELEVTALGSDITFKRNGSTITTISDATFATGDLALITMYDAIAYFDDITVTETLTSSWDFESDIPGALPDEWTRVSYLDLPLGFGSLTIDDYHEGGGSASGLKQVDVIVGWLDGLFVKRSFGTTLISE